MSSIEESGCGIARNDSQLLSLVESILAEGAKKREAITYGRELSDKEFFLIRVNPHMNTSEWESNLLILC